MYECIYDYWNNKTFPYFKQFLINSYNKSINKYMSDNKIKLKRRSDLNKIKRFYNSLEYYLLSIIKMDIVTKENFLNVLRRIEEIDYVELIDTNNEKIHGYTQNNIIYLNNKIKPFSNLDINSSYEAIAFHETGHIITNSFRDSSKLTNKLYNIPGIKSYLKQYNLDDKRYLDYGIALLDEVIAQNTEELVLYDKNNTYRPGKIKRKDDIIFPGRSFKSNFIEYREFQEIGIKFSKCLKFLNCNYQDSDDEVLKKLTKNAFNGNFIYSLDKEIKYSKELPDFILMLACMGRIKDAKYSKCGIGNLNKNELNCNKYLDIFNYLSNLHDTTKTNNNYYRKKY